jgi:hypothetical protein
MFSGSCSLEAACFVGEQAGIGRPDMVDPVTGLVDKSLLTADAEAQGEPRLGMLETVRVYACDRLVERGEEHHARRVHRDYYLGMAELAEVGLRGARYREWHRRVAEDYDNLRAAFDGALADDDGVTALRLASALWLYWVVADRHSEGCRWVEAALSVAPETAAPGVRAVALTVVSFLAGQWHDLSRAIQAGEQAVALAATLGDEWEEAQAKVTLGLVFGAAGDQQRATALLAEARAVMEAIGDDFWSASPARATGYAV